MAGIMSYPGDETFSWQEQMWHVVDWLLVQDVEKVPDSLLAEFLVPVHEDNFPASIAARLQLRQLRVWLRDLKTKGEDHAGDVAEDLLDGLLDLSEDTSRDGEYPLRTLSRKALKPPRALLKMVKKRKASLEDLATGVDKYVEKAGESSGVGGGGVGEREETDLRLRLRLLVFPLSAVVVLARRERVRTVLDLQGRQERQDCGRRTHRGG